MLLGRQAGDGKIIFLGSSFEIQFLSWIHKQCLDWYSSLAPLRSASLPCWSRSCSNTFLSWSSSSCQTWCMPLASLSLACCIQFTAELTSAIAEGNSSDDKGPAGSSRSWGTTWKYVSGNIKLSRNNRYSWLIRHYSLVKICMGGKISLCQKFRWAKKD